MRRQVESEDPWLCVCSFRWVCLYQQNYEAQESAVNSGMYLISASRHQLPAASNCDDRFLRKVYRPDGRSSADCVPSGVKMQCGRLLFRKAVPRVGSSKTSVVGQEQTSKGC